jgi:tRNA (cytidine32/uridine32-2'-O)-methyltransferase
MSLQSNLINIVLVETSHPGNIGSVARAMKTMGLARLSLVNPRKFPSGEANALSGNATDVLDNATVYSSIEEAIKDSTYVYATSSRNRTIQWPTLNSEQAAVTICDQSNNEKGVSILFGREDRGLTNEELQLANTHIEIPANPEYPVLNLAMSTQILCYEIFKASHITNKKANKIFKFLSCIHSNEFSKTFLIHLSALSINVIAFLVHLSLTSIIGIKNAAMISQIIPLRTTSIIQPTNVQLISIKHIVLNF